MTHLAEWRDAASVESYLEQLFMKGSKAKPEGEREDDPSKAKK